MKTMSLRELSCLVTTGSIDDDNVADGHDEWLKKGTDRELEEAHRDFDQWWEANIETLPNGKSNEAYNAVWGLVGAKVQYAHEAGVRTGFRLAMDILMTEQMDGLKIEQRARGSIQSSNDSEPRESPKQNVFSLKVAIPDGIGIEKIVREIIEKVRSEAVAV